MDDLDTEPTIEEFGKAITEMTFEKHQAVSAYRRTCYVNASPV